MAKARASVAEAAEIIISIPIGDGPVDGYEARKAQSGKVDMTQPRSVHVDANLGETAATAFIRMRNGLREQNAKLSNGRPVWSNPDALRWLMEQVAAEVA